jgi:hypothetical protein
MKWFRTAALSFSALATFLGSCTETAIPNHVSDREYVLYSEWVNQLFAKKAPKRLFFYSRTMQFDIEPVESSLLAQHSTVRLIGDNLSSKERDGVSTSTVARSSLEDFLTMI